MKRRAGGRVPRSGCPIGIFLDSFGDRWSLLVVRDLMFSERCSFQGFAAAGEGIATNVLAERLKRLQAAGIVTDARNADDGRKVVYRLTGKGIALSPVLVEMVIWAARHERTEAPRALVKEMERDRAGFLAGLRARWEASAPRTSR